MVVKLNYYTDDAVTLHHGDCLEVLRTLPDCSVDSVVTDPPYGLEFMGKAWDRFDEDSRARAGMTTTGYTDGGERLERPSFLGGLNLHSLVSRVIRRSNVPVSVVKGGSETGAAAEKGDWQLRPTH